MHETLGLGSSAAPQWIPCSLCVHSVKTRPVPLDSYAWFASPSAMRCGARLPLSPLLLSASRRVAWVCSWSAAPCSLHFSASHACVVRFIPKPMVPYDLTEKLSELDFVFSLTPSRSFLTSFDANSISGFDGPGPPPRRRCTFYVLVRIVDEEQVTPPPPAQPPWAPSIRPSVLAPPLRSWPIPIRPLSLSGHCSSSSWRITQA